MKTNRRILGWVLAIGLTAGGGWFAYWATSSRTAVVSWSAVGLPGSEERIASFPELVQLSRLDLRPVDDLPPLPFTLDASEKPAVSLTVERQTLLGADTFAPRPPARIVADLSPKQAWTIAERDALAGAYLDLGQPVEAVAVHRRFLETAEDQHEARRALLDLLDTQNVQPDVLNETLTYFDRLLREAKAEADQRKQDRLLEEIHAVLRRYEALVRRSGSPALNEGETQRRLIDAFPERTALLVDYANRLLDEDRNKEAADLLDPRMDRYRDERVELWKIQARIHRPQGSLDRVIHALEEELRTDDDQDRYQLYAELLQEAELLDARRAALAAAMKAEPSVRALAPLIHLEMASGHRQQARDRLVEQIPALSAGADAATLQKLAELADVLGGLAAPAEALTLDAALLGGEENPELFLRAAERLRQTGQGAAWPFGASPAGVFRPVFVDSFPSVHGGLLSLGTNRLGAGSAMANMPAVGARHDGRRQAILLALRAAEATADPDLLYRALDLAVQLFQQAQLPERIEHYAGSALARLGEGDEHAPRVMLWYADAAALRRDVEGQIAALNRALLRAQESVQVSQADNIQSRLEKLLIDNRRYPEVVALKWQRVERRPQDEAAMKDLLDFAEKYEMFGDVERAYRLALERFDRQAWSDKFARWLMRHKRRADFQALVEQTVRALGENDLARFLNDHLRYSGRLDADDLFFEKIYAVALQRFPANLEMNRRLLFYYEDRGWDPRNPKKDYQDRFLDQALRVFSLDREIAERLFKRLSQRNLLKGMLVKLESARQLQPAEMCLWAGAQRFLARYEAALHGYRELAGLWSCRDEATTAYAALARSLADSHRVRDPRLYETAATAYGRLADRRPLNTAPRISQGETLVQAGQPRAAAAAWEKLLTAAPGEPERWLELATLYWDYYLPDQAKQTLVDGRRVTGQRDMHAKEMGYLLEDEGRLEEALDEYVKVVLNGEYDAGYYDISRRLQFVVRAGKTTEEKVDAACWRRLRRPEGKSGESLAFLQWLRAHGRVDQAKAAAYRLLPLYDDTTFAEGAYQMFAAYNEEQGVEACLKRLLEVSKREPGMLRRAVAFYENRKDLTRADALTEELLSAAKTPSAEEEARQFAAEYFWRTERRERALDFYRRLAETTDDKYQVVGRWVHYAERCLEFGAPDRALEALEKLRAERRTDLAVIAAMARAYAAKDDRQGLVAFYRTVLQDLTQAPLSKAARQNVEVQLRYALIDALTEIEQTREAVEHYIKIINLTAGQGAPEKSVVLAAYNYAKRYDQVKPLLAYYEREAERAHRDFRWQTVAALIYEAQGRYPDAAAMLDKAIANEPQRIDLLERRAETLIKGGDYDQTVKTYETLAARRLTGTDYQLRIVEVLYLAGRPAEAEKRLAEILGGAETSYLRIVAAAQLADRFGRRDAQRTYAERAMGLILASPDKRIIDPGFARLWLQSRLVSKGVKASLADLGGARRHLTQAAANSHPIGRKSINKSLACLDELIVGYLPEWLGQYPDGFERAAAEALYRPLLDEWLAEHDKRELHSRVYDRAIQAATVAQFPRLARDLQRDYLTRWAESRRDERANRAAESLYHSIGLRAPADLADEAALLVTKNILASPDRQSFLLFQADLARALGDESGEKTILRDYVHFSRYQDESYLRRYLSLLSETEIEAYSTGECTFPWELTIWLAEQGKTKQVIRTMEHHRGQEKTWLLAKKALVYQHDPAFGQEAVDAYRELLGLPLSVERYAGKPYPEGLAADEVWTHYALRYAAFQAGRKDAEAALYLYAKVERSPISQKAYLFTTAALDEVGRHVLAAGYLEKAAAFGESDELTIARARHLAKRGKTGAAAEALAALIAGDEVTLWRMAQYAELMAEIDRGKDALPEWRDLLFAQMPKLNEYSRRDALSPLLAFAAKVDGERRAGKLAREFLETDYYQPGDLWLLIEEDALPADIVGWAWQLTVDRLAVDSSTTEYLRRSVAEKALAYGLTARDESLCRSALALIETADPDFFNHRMMRLQRLRTALLFEKAKAAEEMAMSFIQTDPSETLTDDIVKWLRSEGQSAAADRVWLAYIEPLLNKAASARPWDGEDVSESQRRQTLAAYLRLGIADPVPGLTAELEEAAGEDAVRLAELQETLMENGATEQALRLADKAAVLAPMSPEIHRRRAVNDLLAGRADRAAQVIAAGWNAGHDGRDEVDALLAEAARRAAQLDPDAWEEATGNLPSPLRELAQAYLFVERGRGEQALAVLDKLTEPYHYPLLVHRLRARAQRLEDNRAAERAALLECLKYDPQDRGASIRLAWLDLEGEPFAGLWQLGHLDLPLKAWQMREPLSAPSLDEEALTQWWETVPREERNDLALAVLRALEELGWPAGASVFGEATVRALGDQAGRSLRKRVAAATKDLEKKRLARPARFIPDTNLIQ